MKTITAALVASLLVSPVCAGNVSGPKALQLTVYNGNFALVRDTRIINLSKGMNSVEVENVASQIDPTSILLKSLSAPNAMTILEQNYQYDLISPENILNKSVGETVSFITYNENGAATVKSGTLLNPPKNGGTVVKTQDGTLALNPRGEVTVSKMPEGLKPRPTLNWLIESKKEGPQKSEISYITNGLGWKADYVALVNKNDTALDLTGWVTLNNQSGATYKNAKLTLMAGDVRRVWPTSEEARPFNLERSITLKSAKPQFQEQSFFEYHMYSMARPTTIRENETKQLSLLNASGAGVKKEYMYDARGDWFRGWWYPGRNEYDPGAGADTSNYHKVNVVLEAKNSKQNHMGMPLPKGRIRVYKLDDNGGQQFVGEDNIDHTPKDEKIRLSVGNAFDVVGDYKRTDYKRPASDVVEESFEVVIRNHKKEAVIVKIVEHVWADWLVTGKTHKFNKKDAHTIEFPVKVSADGSVRVVYSIRTRWQ